MTIIEQSLKGKKSQETCEDAIVVTSDYVAVIDGSTSKGQSQYHPTMRNGQYAQTLLASYIRSMPSTLSAREFCTLSTSFFSYVYQQHKASTEHLLQHPEDRLTASAIVYSCHQKEIWMVGDCQCLVDQHPWKNDKPYEDPIATIRSGFNQWLLAKGKSVSELQQHDEGRDLILPLLIESCQYQNVNYAVIDGFPIPMQHIKTIDASNAQEIVLASDGYPHLCPTLSASEEALRQVLQDDPLCIRLHRATKGVATGNSSFDDRAYIRFRPFS